ncbi:MAG: SbcC/MukB-like Walker B domain-containing protein [Coriobacteriales bacterium]|nr:SbcC/MukB-like Walker B domain-containing protein [Coriobacteriales bacterium]
MSSTPQLLATQWRLCRIQLINWGTFDGYTNIEVRPTDDEGAASLVCITGKSGTGKSTLFDAGTVLMMPYGRTLNAASNLARGGSPRQDRTYLKGMIDTVVDERGRARGKYLRDDTRLIWGAIVHTWVDTTGALFSAAKFFQLRPDGGDNDLGRYYVTVPGELDPRALEPYAKAPFRRSDIRSVFAGSATYESSGTFLRAIYLTLGIGVNGDGANAMKLLYRIQSGIPMTNVDDLFKELVLDPPSTFDLAQAAIDCYDQAQEIWRRIDEARRKRAMLQGIDSSHATMLEAAQEARLAESLRHDSRMGSLTLWLEQRRLTLVGQQSGVTQQELTRSQQEHVRMEQSRAQLQEHINELNQSIFERGGATLQTLRSRLETERTNKSSVEQRRKNLSTQARTAKRELPKDEAAWDELSGWAHDLVFRSSQEQAQLQEQLVEAGVEEREAQKQTKACQDELAYYRSHRTRITPAMARARDLMAEAAGLDPSSIPFAAELMDVPREQELWRTAVNISLVHIADRIMVDKRIEREFRRAIDPLAPQLGRRYHFDFVDPDQSYLCSPRDGHVSSKVVYREDSPFAAYVRNLVCNSTDHLCVDTVAQLNGGGARITTSGQERVGNRGAIGHSKGTLIIGFSNELLVEECEAKLDEALATLNEIKSRREALARQLSRFDQERSFAQFVINLSWRDIDLAGVEQRIGQLQEQISQLEQDDELLVLQQMCDQARRDYDAAVASCSQLVEQIEQLQHDLDFLATLAEQGQRMIRGLELEGITVTEEQGKLCSAAVAQTEATLGERARIVRRFERVDLEARRFVQNVIDSQRDREAKARQSIETAFRNYHATFMPEDGEHGTDIEEYDFYQGILEEIEREQLSDPQGEWETELLRDVARHLSRLQDAFQTEERLLGERLKPVNEILGQFVFGERRGKLGVVAEPRPSTDVTRFRTRLRKLTALSTAYDFESEEQVQREHRALTNFIETLRADLKTTGKFARRLLDTRHTVHITARETPATPDAQEVIYDSINGKSGGQYQELVAFILGAALLYCLGYNSATMPSYAPVYLDEAFIKADSEHTRRALRALSGLGFQVVIAVPDGKVEAVAPLASQIISLSKDERTNITHARSLIRVRAAEGEDPAWQD